MPARPNSHQRLEVWFDEAADLLTEIEEARLHENEVEEWLHANTTHDTDPCGCVPQPRPVAMFNAKPVTALLGQNPWDVEDLI